MNTLSTYVIEQNPLVSFDTMWALLGDEESISVNVWEFLYPVGRLEKYPVLDEQGNEFPAMTLFFTPDIQYRVYRGDDYLKQVLNGQDVSVMTWEALMFPVRYNEFSRLEVITGFVADVPVVVYERGSGTLKAQLLTTTDIFLDKGLLLRIRESEYLAQRGDNAFINVDNAADYIVFPHVKAYTRKLRRDNFIQVLAKSISERW